MGQAYRIARRSAGQALGTPLPDILYDGFANPAKKVDGKLPTALAIHIRDNGGAGFANFDAPALTASAAKAGKAKAPRHRRDILEYNGPLPGLEPVTIEGIK